MFNLILSILVINTKVQNLLTEDTQYGYSYLFTETQDVEYNVPRSLRLMKAINNGLNYFLKVNDEIKDLTSEVQLYLAYINLKRAKLVFEANADIYLIQRSNVIETLDKLCNKALYTIKKIKYSYVSIDTEIATDVLTKFILGTIHSLPPFLLGSLGSIPPTNFSRIAYRRHLYKQTHLHTRYDTCFLKLLLNNANNSVSNIIGQNVTLKCNIEQACYKHYKYSPGKVGIFLIQSVLYMVYQHSLAICYLNEHNQLRKDYYQTLDEDLTDLCTYMYIEAMAIEAFYYENIHFLENFITRLSICGNHGIAEFVKSRWANLFIDSQSEDGSFIVNGMEHANLSIVTSGIIAYLAIVIRAYLDMRTELERTLLTKVGVPGAVPGKLMYNGVLEGMFMVDADDEKEPSTVKPVTRSTTPEDDYDVLYPEDYQPMPPPSKPETKPERRQYPFLRRL